MSPEPTIRAAVRIEIWSASLNVPVLINFHSSMPCAGAMRVAVLWIAALKQAHGSIAFTAPDSDKAGAVTHCCGSDLPRNRLMPGLGRHAGRCLGLFAFALVTIIEGSSMGDMPGRCSHISFRILGLNWLTAKLRSTERAVASFLSRSRENG